MPVNFQRFSIDIDISTNESKASLEEALDSLVSGSRFKSFEEQTGRKSSKNIPKAHYEFSYTTPDNKEGFILLDVIFEENPFVNTHEVRTAFKEEVNSCFGRGLQQQKCIDHLF